MIALLRQQLLKTRSLASKKAVEFFAQTFGFVYFGQFGVNSDGQLVRGLTTSLGQVDSHYTLGHYRGYDITIVERQTSHPPGYRWLAMQFDLKTTGHPHLYITSYNHSAGFYQDLFSKFTYLGKADQLFSFHDPMFAKFFKVFAAPNDFMAIGRHITFEITTMLGYHFRQFDYELTDNHLYVYSVNSLATPGQLREMLRVGMWLVGKFDIS
ncbi:MAG TPA: hypothetical protein VNG90_01315 [Candidatus Acidoferrum sp.]|nr:hypothetical protein [Candidatus Acidoferrum sp.]